MMTKNQLIKMASGRCSLSQVDIAEAFNTVLDCIRLELAAKGEVRIQGFGNFSVTQSKPRTYYNVKEGCTKVSEPHGVVKFKPAAELKANVY